MTNNPFFRVWGIPLVLTILIVFGLLAALLGTGIWHLLSWMALMAPLVVIIWKAFQKRQKKSHG